MKLFKILIGSICVFGSCYFGHTGEWDRATYGLVIGLYLIGDL